MRGKADSPAGLFLAAHVPLILALVLPLHRYHPFVSLVIRLASVFVTISISTYFCFFTASNDRGADYSQTFYLYTFSLCATDYLLISNAARTLRKTGQHVPATQLHWTDRARWALSLLGSPRGVGWVHEPTKSLPPKPQDPRFTFVFRQLRWGVLNAFLYDMSLYLCLTNPCIASNARQWNDFALWWRVTSLGHLVNIYTGTHCLHQIYGAVSVTLGFSEPSDWRPIFHTPLEAYTLRKFWGTFWHQLMRRPLTVNVDYIAKLLHLPHKNTFTTYTKLFLVFSISGLVHYAQDFIVRQDFKGGAMKFFLLQACAITVEDAFIYVGMAFGLRQERFWKPVGLVWLLVWFSVVLPVWIDPLSEVGYFEEMQTMGFIKLLSLRDVVVP